MKNRVIFIGLPNEASTLTEARKYYEILFRDQLGTYEYCAATAIFTYGTRNEQINDPFFYKPITQLNREGYRRFIENPLHF